MLRRMSAAEVAGATDIAKVPPGTPVVVGTRVVPMPALKAGDRLLAVGRVQELIVLSAEAHAAAREAVDEAEAAVARLGACSPAQVSAFFWGSPAVATLPKVLGRY